MLRDSIFSVTSTGVRILTGLVMFVVMAHAWGPSRFGVFMYPFAIAAIMVRLVDYGFALQLMRDIGRSPSRVHSIMRRAMATKIALVAPTLVAAVIVAQFLPQDGPYNALFVLLLGDALTNSFALFLNVPLRALGRFDAEMHVVTGANVSLFASVIVLVLLGFGPVAIASGFLTVRVGYLAISWLQYRQVLGHILMPRWSIRPITSMLKRGFPFAVHATVGMLNMQVDTLLVQHFLGAGSVGIYQAGMRILLGALLIGDALNNVYLAALAGVLHRPAEVDQLATRMTRHLLTLGVMAFLCTLGGSSWIVRLLFSRSYDGLIPLLPFFGLLMLIRYGGVSYGTLLTLSDKQIVRTIAIIATLFVSLLVNLLLIPRYGLLGAIWAAIISHVCLYSVYVVATWWDHRTLLIDWRSKALVAVAASALLLLFIPGTAAGGTLRLSLGILLILVTVLIGVTRREWHTLSQALVRAS